MLKYSSSGYGRENAKFAKRTIVRQHLIERSGVNKRSRYYGR
jgi:hypothetical protein